MIACMRVYVCVCMCVYEIVCARVCVFVRQVRHKNIVSLRNRRGRNRKGGVWAAFTLL